MKYTYFYPLDKLFDPFNNLFVDADFRSTLPRETLMEEGYKMNPRMPRRSFIHIEEYRNADENLRARFRARRSWGIREKNLSENEATLEALKVFSEEKVSSDITTHRDYTKLKPIIFSKIPPPPSSRNSLSKVSRRISKYTLIKIALYLLIVPITASTIQAALSRAGLTDWFLIAVSWLLAFTTDYLALDHFAKSRRPFESNEDLANSAIAAFILAANLLGAFLLFEKEMKVEESSIISKKVTLLEDRLSNLQEKSSIAEATYLTKKWPKATSPSSCEKERSPSCGPMFDLASKEEKIAYLSLLSQIRFLESKIDSLPKREYTSHQKSDFWWHLGYYAFIWFLLLSVIRLEKISRRRSNAVAA